jgi:hypothetical protein
MVTPWSRRWVGVILAATLSVASARAEAQPAPAPNEKASAAAPPAPVGHPPPTWGFEGPYRFDIGFHVGFAPRADDPPLFQATNDAGLSGGVSLRLYTSERIGFGLGYDHVGLWREESGLLDNGTFELSRAFDTLWAWLRLRPVRGEDLGAFLDLGVGPSWQRVSLRGVFWDPVTPGLRTPVSCNAGGDLGFAFRGQAGMEVAITESFGTELGVGLELYRHSSDAVGACAPGAGTAVVPTLRLGFVYGWEL